MATLLSRFVVSIKQFRLENRLWNWLGSDHMTFGTITLSVQILRLLLGIGFYVPPFKLAKVISHEIHRVPPLHFRNGLISPGPNNGGS